MGVQFLGVQGYVVEFVSKNVAKIRLRGGAEVLAHLNPEILQGALVIERPCPGCRHKGWMLLCHFREEHRHTHEGNIYAECLRCWNTELGDY